MKTSHQHEMLAAGRLRAARPRPLLGRPSVGSECNIVTDHTELPRGPTLEIHLQCHGGQTHRRHFSSKLIGKMTTIRYWIVGRLSGADDIASAG